MTEVKVEVAIGGVQLNAAEIMTICLALQHYDAVLNDNILGTSTISVRVRDMYLDQIARLREALGDTQ